VIPVSPFGRAVPQAPWRLFRERTGVAVVIDGGGSFEAISADPTRYLGEIPVALSFHATKSFSTAEGGCVITTDSRWPERLSQALNFGFFATRDCRAASTNGKMSDYHAAVGLAELDGWAAKHDMLRTVANSYRQKLNTVGLGDSVWVAPDVASCYALFRCACGAEVESVLRSLEESNVETRFWYGHGVHRQSYYADASRDSLPVTERIAPLSVGLPVALDLPEACLERVVAATARGVASRL
jgi:dTDP-4-amino-4,6-dideoxygalactose transaminase